MSGERASPLSTCSSRLELSFVRIGFLEDRDLPYRSGKNPGWIKVKCRSWREANRNRWEMFERG